MVRILIHFFQSMLIYIVGYLNIISSLYSLINKAQTIGMQHIEEMSVFIIAENSDGGVMVWLIVDTRFCGTVPWCCVRSAVHCVVAH